jgi:Holliday junction resolvasome RuvABC endonuclease subunit
MIVLGIDPGASGGLALLRQDGGGGIHVLDCVKVPPSDVDLWRWFADLSDSHYADLAVLEKVHAMPGQGVSSTFRFGQSYGSLRMAVIAAGIPLEEVTPRKWQPAVGVSSVKGEAKTQHKNRLKARAQELYRGRRSHTRRRTLC